jgi:hypothetical protein
MGYKTAIDSFYAQHKRAVDDTAAYINVPPMWLLCVLYQESGLQASIVNNIGAVGLNQLTPDTAATHGIDISAFRTNGADYQLQQMKKFYASARGKIKRAGDLYMFNFLPVVITNNIGFDVPLGVKNSTDKFYGLSKGSIYSHNSGLDYNKDGIITRRDVTDYFENKFGDLVKINAPARVIRDIKVDATVFKEKKPVLFWVGSGLVIASVAVFGSILIYKGVKKD